MYNKIPDIITRASTMISDVYALPCFNYTFIIVSSEAITIIYLHHEIISFYFKIVDRQFFLSFACSFSSPVSSVSASCGDPHLSFSCTLPAVVLLLVTPHGAVAALSASCDRRSFHIAAFPLLLPVLSLVALFSIFRALSWCTGEGQLNGDCII
jgi:hypothetical protein